jgi:hypothetical protein
VALGWAIALKPPNNKFLKVLQVWGTLSLESFGLGKAGSFRVELTINKQKYYQQASQNKIQPYLKC